MEMFSTALVFVLCIHVCVSSDIKEEITEAITDSKRKLHYNDNRNWHDERSPAEMKWVQIKVDREREDGGGQGDYNEGKPAPAQQLENKWHSRELNQYPTTMKQYEIEGEQSQNWDKHSRGKYDYGNSGDGKTYYEPPHYRYSAYDKEDNPSRGYGKEWQKHDFDKHSYESEDSGEDHNGHRISNHDDREPGSNGGHDFNHKYYGTKQKHDFEENNYHNNEKDHKYNDGKKSEWQNDQTRGYKEPNKYNYGDDDRDNDNAYGRDIRYYSGNSRKHQKNQREPTNKEYSPSQGSGNKEKDNTKQESNGKFQEPQKDHGAQNIVYNNAIQQSGSYPLPSDMRWWQGWAQGWHQAVKSV